ncbi:4-hydroxy-tetrahydrodipicolinate synthase [Magnetovibrio blakemorei]|uniref:4-hydroxy-tetrahydrodipicolinate synthase n=1 Tax=Magnetovibrio blakemorei TaxID=28181 RepID=A0A1E5QBT1_9PROT|nr:4-hydroxy-tetrahydrodipicolinate synthase [Magnetovibrio blakemorei]OEJ69406.1 4-hydroxy-tetrahydrodipicolinate synthase [Magnetovibrio blakemorei]
MYKGSFVALLTPFQDGIVDEKAYQSFVDWQVKQGTDGVIPCGTTGESPTLTHAEHRRVTEMCIEVTAGRIPVMAGAGSNSTAEAVALAVHAEQAGANSVLVVTPYYNKPTQAGLYAHFKAVNDAVGIPIFIYNIPGRSVVDMSLETMKRLSELPNIAGVKDATGDVARPVAYAKALGPDFCQMSGEDATAIPYLAAGGHGCISVTANIAPALCAEQHAAWAAGNVARAMEIQQMLIPVHQSMFCESSPGPVKYAAQLMGLCSAEMRLPLCEIADSSKIQVENAIRTLGLIN